MDAGGIAGIVPTVITDCGALEFARRVSWPSGRTRCMDLALTSGRPAIYLTCTREAIRFAGRRLVSGTRGSASGRRMSW
jgi:hypothetical protein